jgi:hypothetical protein
LAALVAQVLRLASQAPQSLERAAVEAALTIGLLALRVLEALEVEALVAIRNLARRGQVRPTQAAVAAAQQHFCQLVAQAVLALLFFEN